MLPTWLPAIITLDEHNGDWDQYLEALHAVFTNDFLTGELLYEGKRVALKRHPIENGKEATFWHFISTGQTEADREIDLRRCERIGWPRAVLENCEDGCLKIWTENVRGDQRVQIWCEPAEYLVVLADRGNYVLPWTAYPVVRAHQQKKLIDRWKKATGA